MGPVAIAEYVTINLREWKILETEDLFRHIRTSWAKKIPAMNMEANVTAKVGSKTDHQIR